MFTFHVEVEMIKITYGAPLNVTSPLNTYLPFSVDPFLKIFYRQILNVFLS